MSIESELIKTKSDREMQYQTHGLFNQKRHGNIKTEEKNRLCVLISKDQNSNKKTIDSYRKTKKNFFVVALSPELRALFRCYYV